MCILHFFCFLPISRDVDVDRLVLVIKWSEASMISYTLSPCATRSTWKITNRNVVHGSPEVELAYSFTNAVVCRLTMECPRCSETLSDRYRSFPSPVRSIKNPGSACTNSDSSWKDRNPALSSRLAAVPAPRGNNGKWTEQQRFVNKPELNKNEHYQTSTMGEKVAAVGFRTADSDAAVFIEPRHFSTMDSNTLL